MIVLGRSDRLQTEADGWARSYGAERVLAHQIDMYDLGALRTTFEQIVRTEDRIDILVNNAHELGASTGFNVPEGILERGSLEQWQRNLTGGVFWPLLAVQTIGASMRDAGRGSIINISTMYAHVAPNPLLYEGTPSMNPAGYSAAKAALLALTRYIASFWGPFGLRANSILPGPFSNTDEPGLKLRP